MFGSIKIFPIRSKDDLDLLTDSIMNKNAGFSVINMAKDAAFPYACGVYYHHVIKVAEMVQVDTDLVKLTAQHV